MLHSIKWPKRTTTVHDLRAGRRNAQNRGGATTTGDKRKIAKE
jgi:hypothetical protein